MSSKMTPLTEMPDGEVVSKAFRLKVLIFLSSIQGLGWGGRAEQARRGSVHTRQFLEGSDLVPPDLQLF